ncbi:MAG: hypothetical protein H6716_24070 [Polyangiaceae bacterium]|nr:hypothetical protein [Polyangiaceae bacterium]
MTPDEIASRIGWEGVELELIDYLDSPAVPVAQGLVMTAALPAAQFVDTVELHGLMLARYLDDPRCVAVSGVPRDAGGSSHVLDGGIALDGRAGDAWACFESDNADLLVFNMMGDLSVCRVRQSPAVRSLRALSQPAVDLEAALPSLDDLVRSAADHPHTPPWLADATAARAGDELVHGLDAMGLVARHAYGPAVDFVREWAQALVPPDVSGLERMIARHVERARDALDEALNGDAFAVYILVRERDRLESLLALRSFAGMGSPVRASVRQLDNDVFEQLTLLPDPPAGAFEGDPSFAAADGFAPDAWWAEFAR